MALLEEWAGVDQFDTLEDKFNALVGMINDKFAGGAAGQVPRKIDSADFNYEFVSSLKWITINIGDWNMDTTAEVVVSHGLTSGTIRVIDVVIFADNGNSFPLLQLSAADGLMEAGYGFTGLNGGNLSLKRRTGGGFDNSNYDSTSFNRGLITIGYAS